MRRAERVNSKFGVRNEIITNNESLAQCARLIYFRKVFGN